MRPLFFAIAAGAVLACSPATAQQVTPPTQSAGGPTQFAVPQGRVAQLIEQMRAGGLVLVIRHERTEIPSHDDDFTRPRMIAPHSAICPWLDSLVLRKGASRCARSAFQSRRSSAAPCVGRRKRRVSCSAPTVSSRA